MINTKMEGLCEDISRKGRCVKRRVGEKATSDHEGKYEKDAVTSVLGPPLNLGRTVFIEILHTKKYRPMYGGADDDRIQDSETK